MTRKKTDTRSLGLDVGLAFSKFLTGRENLHYGIWENGLDVCAANVGAAQEAYTAKLFDLLPDRKGLHILDIGGGAGETAKKLIALGHHVEIVIPSPFLAERCRDNAGPSAVVHECGFQEFFSDKTFDICLFSESFQYIPMDLAIVKSLGLLADDGVIIVSDCFRKETYYTATDEIAKVGGGHSLADFRSGLDIWKVDVASEFDITDAVAPTVDVEQELFNVIGYAIQRTDEALAQSRPLLRRTLRRVTRLFISERRRRRLDQRLNQKTRTAENFCRYNTYLMLKLVAAK